MILNSYPTLVSLYAFQNNRNISCTTVVGIGNNIKKLIDLKGILEVIYSNLLLLRSHRPSMADGSSSFCLKYFSEGEIATSHGSLHYRLTVRNLLLISNLFLYSLLCVLCEN